MWALKGEVWRAGFDPTATRDWPIARWIANDFIAGCPDIAVVDTRETINYIKVLSRSDPAFTRLWSHYHPITAFGGLIVYHRDKHACRKVTIATASPGIKHRSHRADRHSFVNVPVPLSTSPPANIPPAQAASG
jgi:hypothetical protein